MFAQACVSMHGYVGDVTGGRAMYSSVRNMSQDISPVLLGQSYSTVSLATG